MYRIALNCKKIRHVETSYLFRIELQGVKPAIWRTFQVDQEESLLDLHEIIQIVMGWENAHLFEFQFNGRRFAPLMDEEEIWEDSDSIEDCEEVLLEDLKLKEGDVLSYIYDLGDDWVHSLVVEKIVSETTLTPKCLGGGRNCPVEDSGGPFGYLNMLEVLANPSHPEYAEMSEWIGDDFDPEEFFLEEVNLLLGEYEEWRQNSFFFDDDEEE